MKLLWSHAARADLEAIRDYSIDRWGREVAFRYLSDIRNAAVGAAAAPGRTRALRDGFRLARVRSHVLILHANDTAGEMTVSRVLHAAMDLERHLPR